MRVLVVVAALGVTLLFVGCGAVSTTENLTEDLSVTAAKIHEEAGPGTPAQKQSPLGIETGPSRVIATPLLTGDPPTSGYTYVGRISWFDFGAPQHSNRVVLLQPEVGTAEDTDLYVLIPPVSAKHLRGFQVSQRGSLGQSLEALADWCQYVSPVAGRYSVAVNGFASPSDSTPNFTIELDTPINLPVNGLSAAASESSPGSDWFWFFGYVGTQYTVTLAAGSGDPDVYVYANRSTRYIDKNVATGGGSVSFQAPWGCRYMIRVYAFTDSSYTIGVTSP